MPSVAKERAWEHAGDFVCNRADAGRSTCRARWAAVDAHRRRAVRRGALRALVVRGADVPRGRLPPARGGRAATSRPITLREYLERHPVAARGDAERVVVGRGRLRRGVGRSRGSAWSWRHVHHATRYASLARAERTATPTGVAGRALDQVDPRALAPAVERLALHPARRARRRGYAHARLHAHDHRLRHLGHLVENDVKSNDDATWLDDVCARDNFLWQLGSETLRAPVCDCNRVSHPRDVRRHLHGARHAVHDERQRSTGARSTRSSADQIAGGVTGIVPCGTTGESPTLSHEEQKRGHRADRRRRVAARRRSSRASDRTRAPRTAIELAKQAEAAGADAVMVVVPYYNKPTQEGLFRHFVACREGACSCRSSSTTSPRGTGVDLGVDTIARICEAAPNVVATKEATGNVLRAQQLAARFGDRLAMLSGDDALTLPMIAVGATRRDQRHVERAAARGRRTRRKLALSGRHEARARRAPSRSFRSTRRSSSSRASRARRRSSRTAGSARTSCANR